FGLVLAASGAAPIAAAAEDRVPEPPVWIARPDGRRLRVRFDPGQRLIVGAGADRARGGAAPALELGLRLRANSPLPDRDVHWNRDHELLQIRLAPARIDGALYRGLYLRWSREGTLTLPSSPPVALSL